MQFSSSCRLLLDHPEALFSFEVERGYQESTILAAVVTKAELEPKADKCTKVNNNDALLCRRSTLPPFYQFISFCYLFTKVYVWHTRTENPKLTSKGKAKQTQSAADLTVEV